MTYRAPLYALAACSLAACGGSYGSNNTPELPATTDNAATLASAVARANSTDGTQAFQAFRRANAHVGLWGVTAEDCPDGALYVAPGRIVDPLANRACRFGDFAREEVSGGITVGINAECPVANAEPTPDGEIPSEEVSFTFAITDDLSTANVSIAGAEAVTLTSCEVLLAPPAEDGQEEEDAE